MNDFEEYIRQGEPLCFKGNNVSTQTPIEFEHFCIDFHRSLYLALAITLA